MRVFIFVCGEGLGHTARSMAAGRELAKTDHDVVFGAYGYSAEIIRKNGFRVISVPAEIRLVGEKGSLNMRASVRESLKLGQLQGLRKVTGMVKREKPDVVLADSYYLGTLAALRWHIPVCLMVNQSNMEVFFEQSWTMRRLGRIARLFYNRVFVKVDNIIVPDFPAPHTICRRNLNFTKDMEKKVLYTGPLPAKKTQEVEGKKLPRPHVLSLVGGFGYRKPIFDRIIEAASSDRSVNYTMLTGPGISKEEFTGLPENVAVLPFVPDQYPYLKSSDAVIAPGGHTTMMEALAFGLPVISFPDIGHSEQQNNARGLEESGCGFSMNYDATAGDILEKIRLAVSGKLACPEELSEIAAKLNGTVSLRLLLEKLAGDQRI